MGPPPRSLVLDAHYCIMVRASWPTAYKYARAIARAGHAPLGIDISQDSAMAAQHAFVLIPAALKQKKIP